MQVFKTYFRILKKMLPGILIYAIIFLGITLLIALNLQSEDNRQYEMEEVSAIIINQDEENAFTDGLIGYLDDYIEYKDIKEEEEAIKDALFFREIVYVLTIPEGFTKAFLAGEEIPLRKQTAPNSTGAWTLDTVIDDYLNTAKIYLDYNPDLTMEELNQRIAASLNQETKVTYDINKKDEEIISNIFNMNFYNYLSYAILSCFIIGVSAVMLSYHSLEIRRRHYAAPISSRSLNAQLILGNLLFVLCFLVLFVIAGYFLNPYRRINVNIILFWVNAIVLSITTLSLSYLIGITVKSRNAVQALSTMISLSLSFMTGVFVPQEFLGSAVLKVASFTPTYWYVKANNLINSLSLNGLKDLSKIFGYMVIQLGFAAAILAIALVVSKRKSQQAS